MAISEELKIVVKAEVDRAVRGLKNVQRTMGKTESSSKKLGKSIGKMALTFGGAFLTI